MKRKIKIYASETMKRVHERFSRIYDPETADVCLDRLATAIGRYGIGLNVTPASCRWSEKNSVLITYGDSIRNGDEPPLATLNEFIKQRLNETISTTHILPFFPYSSDDGFSVIDYRAVNPDLGAWEDVQAISHTCALMFDLVINHTSRQSAWFRDYVSSIAPCRDYFIEQEKDTDLSMVVRPRISPLLSITQTRDGERYVWTTFSEDQVDLDFHNPDVLFEFIDILFLYISKGVRIIRLDAIAYLWKKPGTPCIHLEQTHEIVKILRDILDMVAPEVLLLTETNVPHEDNVGYFGQGDEAHMVYQFTLPPLLLHAIRSGTAHHLTDWASGLGDLPPGCTYLNFTASHDGIGVRPLRGLVPSEEVSGLTQVVEALGGYISSKTDADGAESPYALNITYFDAFADSANGAPTDAHIRRFICSQTVPLALKGIPALYINSLLAGRNNTDGVEFTGQARSINRGKWNKDELDRLLDDSSSLTSQVFQQLSNLLRIRAAHPAFHPDASQVVHDVMPELFVIERTAPDESETVVAVTNVAPNTVSVKIGEHVSVLAGTNTWPDWIRGKPRSAKGGRLELQPYETCWLSPA